MTKINTNNVGLAVGGVFAAWHLLWSLLVAAGWAQPLIDSVYRMHFLEVPIMVLPFDVSTAVSLVFVTFIVGYLIGYVFGTVWNRLHQNGK
jgi:hypothetical protein